MTARLGASERAFLDGHRLCAGKRKTEMDTIAHADSPNEPAAIKYFTLSAAYGRRVAEVHCPVDASGEPFPSFQRVPVGARGTCRCVDRRTGFADCIRSVPDLIVSQRAAEVFKKFLLQEGTDLLPVDVIGRNGKALFPMVAVLFPKPVEAVNLRESKYKQLTEGIPWYFTEPPVLEAAPLCGLDLLLCYSVRYICSARLRREIEKEELTNFAFEPVVVR